MAELTVQQLNLTGLVPSFSAADVAGDTFTNSGRTYLHIKNGGAAGVTVTIDSQQPCNYGFDHDVDVSIDAGAEKLIGPFSKSRFNDDNGKVNVAYSDVTNVTVAAIEMP